MIILKLYILKIIIFRFKFGIPQGRRELLEARGPRAAQPPCAIVPTPLFLVDNQ
jgi:hypothetical protein